MEVIMQFIDLKAQYNYLKDDIDKNIMTVVENCRFIMGEEVFKLENDLANYVGVKNCVTCANGTEALFMPLMAWNIKHGDAVFVPSFSFYATAEAVSLTGATPIFIDIDPCTYNIDVKKLEEAIKNVKSEGKFNPKAIIPVDLFGLPADYDEIIKISEKYGLLVLEDAAQGFGGKNKEKKACSFGHAAATSFFPAKPLGCYGDGGAIFTNDDNLADRLRSIRIHGQGSNKYENVRVGLNSRLDNIQAAVLLAKLKVFDNELNKRNNAAKYYTDELNEYLVTPAIPDGFYSSWAQYSLLAKDSLERKEIMRHLKSKDIPIMIYYNIPLHMQRVYINSMKRYCDLSVSESISSKIFSIPIHPYLKEEEILFIIKNIKKSLFEYD